MNYSLDIVMCAAASGAAWELCALCPDKIFKVVLRAVSFVFGAMTLGYLVLQFVSLTRL